jgi:hypothetical protein
MTASHDGGCMCGRIRFSFGGTPRFVATCHCAPCRRWTGAPMTTYVGGRDEEVSWSGAAPAIYESSPGVERLFCPQCGTALAYRGAKWAGETHLLLGAFDAPDAFTPTRDVFVDEALAWLKPAPDRR